jgi:phage antirepressor YoqD-like protein
MPWKKKAISYLNIAIYSQNHAESGYFRIRKKNNSVINTRIKINSETNKTQQ